jgi:tetratricopeptide (TPR) repeat protein
MADRRHASRQVRRAEARRKTTVRPEFRWDRLIAPLLVAAALFAYHNSLKGEFVLDDRGAILQNETIRTLWPPWAPLRTPPKSSLTGRPIVNLSLALNYAVSGFDPTTYHLFNVFFHALAALVLFGVVRRTLAAPALGNRFEGRKTGLAAAVALLWVVHPLASETVDYTIQRTELLMSFFFLLTFYGAIRGFEQTGREKAWFAVAIAAFALGLGCKEVIAVAPIALLLYDWLFWSKSFGEALRRHRILYLGLAAVLVLVVAVIGSRLRRAFSGLSRRMSPWHYALTQFGVIVHYLRLAVWPHPLVADYGNWPVARTVTSVLPSLLLVAALVGLTVWGLVRRAPLAFLGVWFFGILAPTSSIRPLSVEIAAERRMYLPLVAVIVLAVLGIEALFRWADAPRAAKPVTVGALALILALATVRRAEAYRTMLSFWNDVLAKWPDDARAHIWMGNYYKDRGQTADAFAQFQESVRIQPDNSNAHNGLGAVLVSQGKIPDAVLHYREAIRLDPDNALAHNNLGSVLVADRVDEAVEHFRDAVRINPDYASAHANLARALVRQGLTIEAIEHYETALRLQPDFPAARKGLDDVRREISQ